MLLSSAGMESRGKSLQGDACRVDKPTQFRSILYFMV